MCAMSTRETLPPALPILHRYNRLATHAQLRGASPLAALALMDRDFTADGTTSVFMCQVRNIGLTVRGCGNGWVGVLRTDYEVLLLLDEFNVTKAASKAQLARLPCHTFQSCPKYVGRWW